MDSSLTRKSLESESHDAIEATGTGPNEGDLGEGTKGEGRADLDSDFTEGNGRETAMGEGERWGKVEVEATAPVEAAGRGGPEK